MKRMINVGIIILFLVAVCIIEEIIVKNTLSYIEDYSTELYSIANSNENVNSNDLIDKTEFLYNYWDNREKMLCFFINHKDMKDMAIEIDKMISYAKQNIKEEYIASCNLVIMYSDMFHHIMGVSVQNVF